MDVIEQINYIMKDSVSMDTTKYTRNLEGLK